MKAYEIHLADLQRILFGQVPAIFYVEVALRILFIYALVVFSMRRMGKRISSNLSRNEMAATIALAAAVGIPVHTPERGLLPAVIVAGIVIIGQNYIARRSTQSNRFEYRVLGHISTLVKDGELILEEMVRSRLSQDRIFSEIRAESLTHLGQVKRLYFEANGTFSLVQEENPVPGLSVVPEADAELRAQQKKEIHKHVCTTCGKEKGYLPLCENCKSKTFTTAVT
ncbi:uncharacterized membrane protein YcaP (DUF421 family) [Filimonas zeae]|uniref:YetF C-terminal domain-containing protein n=1 Tax=Filimonas zeae TaxID=1737353 RepID=A0A917IUL7_9BACT|nr:YetF domain-containing protein [Filimonas zeae]MDR6339564.1 uncharacterized membrane protein YcaP (DUF421 family) [Filimonas zeae]GGH63027.1 hypothetical protein GCM10011379_13470 [Filimonas zeae]